MTISGLLGHTVCTATVVSACERQGEEEEQLPDQKPFHLVSCENHRRSVFTVNSYSKRHVLEQVSISKK